MIKPVDKGVLTEKEKDILNQIKLLRDSLINKFEEGNTHFGLKNHKRCWCGKIGRYEPTYEIWDKSVTLVCKKHIEKIE